MTTCNAGKCNYGTRIVSPVVQNLPPKCMDVCVSPICADPTTLGILAPLIYDEIGINLCTTFALGTDISATYPTAAKANVQLMDLTYTYGEGNVQVEPITGRPNCYQVTLSNLTASFAMNIYDSDCRLLGTIYPTAVYLPPETTSATYNEDTNPVSVTLEIFAPYGVSYNEGETPTAALSYIGFQAGNNMVRQGINLLAIPKMIGFDTDGDTATIGLTVILQSLYYAGYNVASGGKIQTPKGSIVSPDNSDCKQFVAGELLDLAIKPLELGPPKFEQCLKRDYSSPTCGTCSSGEAGSGNNGCPFDTTALTPPEPKVP